MAKKKRDASYGIFNPKFVYTIEAIGRLMAVQPRYIRDRYVNTGIIPVVQIGRRLLISGESFVRWVKENEAIATPKANHTKGPQGRGRSA